MGRTKRTTASLVAAGMAGVALLPFGAARGEDVEVIDVPVNNVTDFLDLPGCTLAPQPAFVGNSFTVARSGEITSIALYPNGARSSVFSAPIDVFEGEGFGGDVLGSEDVTWTGAPTGEAAAQTVLFDPPIPVEAGSVYSYRVSNDCSDPVSDNSPVFLLSSAPYDGGDFVTSSPDGEFVDGTVDQAFRVEIAVDGAPMDADGDGVVDAADVCPDTVLPDVPTRRLGFFRFAAQEDGSFDAGWRRLDGRFTIADTGGCSGTQIIENLDLGRRHTKFGISYRALTRWIHSLD